MKIHEILEIENHGRNDISAHPRPREDCHGNNDPSACLSAPSLTIPFLAHFPATLSRFHSFLPRFLLFDNPREPENIGPQRISGDSSAARIYVTAKNKSGVASGSSSNPVSVTHLRKKRRIDPLLIDRGEQDKKQMNDRWFNFLFNIIIWKRRHICRRKLIASKNSFLLHVQFAPLFATLIILIILLLLIILTIFSRQAAS